MGLRVAWNSSSICHHCFARKESYASVPAVMYPRRSAENFASAACRPWDCNLPTDQCCRVMISGVVHSGTCMDDCICPLRHANANPQLRSQSDTMVQYAHPELGCVELDGGIHP